jgi:hypothetical protein
VGEVDIDAPYAILYPCGHEAIIRFPLPEHQQQFEDAQNGWKWRVILQELDRYWRNMDSSFPDDKYYADYIIEKLYDEIGVYHLELFP